LVGMLLLGLLFLLCRWGLVRIPRRQLHGGNCILEVLRRGVQQLLGALHRELLVGLLFLVRGLRFRLHLSLLHAPLLLVRRAVLRVLGSDRGLLLLLGRVTDGRTHHAAVPLLRLLDALRLGLLVSLLCVLLLLDSLRPLEMRLQAPEVVVLLLLVGLLMNLRRRRDHSRLIFLHRLGPSLCAAFLQLLRCFLCVLFLR